MRNVLRTIATFVAFVLLGWNQAHAAGESYQSITVDGTLYADPILGTPLFDAGAVLTISIYNPAADCLVYEETQTVNTMATAGKFAIEVGSATGAGKRTVNDSNNAMLDVFQNVVAIPGTGAGCPWTPSAGDERLVRITLDPTVGGPVVMSPDMKLTNIPNALVCESVQGLDRSKLLEIGAAVHANATQANYTSLIDGSDVGALHNHDGVYAQLNNSGSMTMGAQTTFEFGAYTTAQETTLTGGLGAADEGKTWWNSDTDALMYWDGATAQVVGTGGGAITSVFGRTGVVVAATSDYDAIQIDNVAAGNLIATNVQAAINELDTEKLALAGGTMTGNIAMGTNSITGLADGVAAQDAATMNNLSSAITANNASYVAKAGDNMTGALTLDAQNELRLADDAGGDYISFKAPSGMSSNYDYTLPGGYGSNGQVLTTDGAGLLTWAADDGVLPARDLIAGAGLTGGGDLSADRTFDVVGGDGITANADDIEVDIAGLTAETTPDGAADMVMIYDDSATALRKMTVNNLTSLVGGSQDLDAVYDQGGNTVAVDSTDVIFNLSAGRAVLISGGNGLQVSGSELILDGAGAYLDYKPNNVKCADGEVIKWVDANDRWECGTDDDTVGAPTSRDLIAGSGMTGGGDLTADRTFDVVGGDGIVANANDIAVDFTADKGLHFVSNKLEVEAGAGILLDANGVNVDVAGLTAEATPDGAADMVMIYDDSATALRKMTVNNLTSLVGGSQDLDAVYDQAGNTVAVDTSNVVWNLSGGNNFQVVGGDFILNGANAYFNYQPNNTECGNNEVLKWDNTNDRWICGTDNAGAGSQTLDETYDQAGNTVAVDTSDVIFNLSAGRAFQISGGNGLHVSGSELILDGAGAYLDYKPNNVKCADGEVIKWVDANDRWECGTDDDTVGAPTSRDLIAGSGLTGGGDLTADRTFNVIGGDGITANADDIEVDIDGLTAETTPDGAADTVMIYDNSATALRKMTINNLTSLVGGNQNLAQVYDQGTNTVPVTDADGDVIWNLTQNSDFHIQDAGAAAFTVADDGSVGVGTATPQSPLHVFNADVSRAILATEGTDGTDQNSLLLLTKASSTTGAGDAAALGWHIIARGDAYSTTAQQNDLMFTYWDGTSYHNAMAVDSLTRNIGIGTATPESQLEISGGDAAIQLRGQGTVDYSSSIRFAQNNTTWRGGYIQYDGSANQMIIGVHNAGDELVASDIEAIAIDRADGKVGISTYLNYQPNGTECAANEVLKWDDTNDRWICGTDNTGGGSGTLDQAYDAGAATVTVDGTGGGDVVWNLTSTNVFKIQDGGTDAFVVDDSGNVGVGGAPSAKFHVAGGEVVIDGAGAYLDYKPNNVKCADGDVIKWVDANDRWECGTDDDTVGAPTTRDLIAGSGLTGGGDLTADRTFNVIGGDGITANADDIEVDIAGLTAETTPDGAADMVMIYDDSATALRKMTVNNLTSLVGGNQNLAQVYDQGTNTVPVTDADGDIIWNLTETSDFKVQDNGTDAFIVDDSGNVGIGAAPTNKLHVDGGIGFFNLPTASTNASSSSLVLRQTSTGDMVDYFGPNIRFEVDDTAASPQVLGRLIVSRDGADNEGQLIFNGGTDGGDNLMTLRASGSIGIGTASPDATALLDVSSTTKGFLPPRMTTAQRTGITTPAEGLIVYDTDLDKLYIVENSSWAEVGSGTTTIGGYEIITNTVAAGVAVGWKSATCPAGKQVLGGSCTTSNGAIAINTRAYSTTFDCYKHNLVHTWTVRAICAYTTDGAAIAVMGDNDDDTKIQAEESADEDILRFDAGGNEIATMNASGVVEFGNGSEL